MKNFKSITKNLRNQLKELLAIDSTSPSGLRWKIEHCRMNAGSVAGSLRKDGYWQICVNRKLYQNHRIVWALAHEKDPVGFQIDHIDGNPSNNHEKNLRLATVSENQRNRTRLQCNNISGHSGVSWRCDKKKWRARIKINNKETHLGSFDSYEKAVEARRLAEINYYGEFRPIRD